MSDDLHDDDDIAARFDGFFDDETVTAIDSPAAPAAETAQPDAPETGATDAGISDRGDGRDAQGRFAPKGQPAADSLDAPGANAADGAQPKTPGTPAPPTDAGALQGTPEQSPPPESALEVQPLTIRVGQTDHAIPGAVLTPHGAVIPPESLQHLHEVYGRGIKYAEERDTIKRERAQLTFERDAHRAEVAPVMREIDQIFGLFRQVASAPTAEAQQTAVEKLLEYGLTFAQNEPLLKERMQFERERAEFQLTQRAQQPDVEEQATQIRTHVDHALDSLIQQAAGTEYGTLLTKEDWGRVKHMVHSNPTAYVGRAGQQLTAEEQAAGMAPGGMYLKLAAIEQQVGLIADLRRSAKANEAQHQQALAAVKKAADENSKRASAPKVGAPSPKPSAAKRPAVVQEEEDEDLDDRLHRVFSGVIN